MKKFLFILTVFALTLSATVLPTQKTEAQQSFISQYGNTIDTSFTGFLTKNLTLTTQVPSTYNIVEIVFTATKISGTVAGTATVQESIDGTLWCTAPGTTAYTITDGTQTTGFKITNYGAKYIRLQVVGSGTMSAQIKAVENHRRLMIFSPK